MNNNVGTNEELQSIGQNKLTPQNPTKMRFTTLQQF